VATEASFSALTSKDNRYFKYKIPYQFFVPSKSKMPTVVKKTATDQTEITIRVKMGRGDLFFLGLTAQGIKNNLIQFFMIFKNC